MFEINCAACAQTSNDMTGIQFGTTRIMLCRGCLETLRRSLDKQGPDRILRPGNKIHIRVLPAAPEPDDGVLRVCGGTEQRLKAVPEPTEPAAEIDEPKRDTSKLGHLADPGGMTEYLIPVLCTGVKYVRTKMPDYSLAIKSAEDKIKTDNRYATDGLRQFTARALAPELALDPDQRKTWPYWAYGYYGTDGVNWRACQTDRGPGSIPDIAEESWPIPPFEPKDKTRR